MDRSDSRDSAGQSADLRTRIAKALYGQLFWITTPFQDQPDDVQDAWLFQADIVIRELGLKEERRNPISTDPGITVGTWKIPTEIRYVTDWTADA